MPAQSLAQVGNTDSFFPRSWQPGAERENANRSRSGRRSTSAATRLDEFDVPRRGARRSAYEGMRVVERKRTPKRVRVAALTGASASDALPRRAVKKQARHTRVAALGNSTPTVKTPAPPSLTGGGISWRVSSSCLASNLRSVLASVAATFGSVTVNSTCRSQRHNRRVGGARKSWHLTGNAADFRVHGASVRRVFAFLRGSVGGLKHYGGGLFHIDNGPRRSF